MAQRGFDPTMNTIKTIAQSISVVQKFFSFGKAQACVSLTNTIMNKSTSKS